MIFTPKVVAKNRFKAFKNSIPQIDFTQLPLPENEYNNFVKLPMIKFRPSGEKASLFYDKLCNDYLDRINI